jgi:uncharacterized protein
VIIPDINLLVYAYNKDAPHHAAARAWWEKLMSDSAPVGIPWVVSLGFVRLLSHPRIVVAPFASGDLIGFVRSWLARPHVAPLVPGANHLDILQEATDDAGFGANLMTDAHLAALAIETQSELHSADHDFARFRGLRWRNPLTG